MATSKTEMRLAVVADLHCSKASQGSWHALFQQISEAADVLALCGDLTNFGLPEEAHVLVKELSVLKIPIIAVLGNHDYESGQQVEIHHILSAAGIQLLDGEAHEIQGVGFAGAKGFGGGFGQRVLAPWGEETVKRFVREALDETLKLESALARLRTDKRIVLLHYAPIQETVEGEPLEIYPFLGCSRLEEPLNRFPVTAIFHGHAHHGSYQGRTKTNIPVYNVAHQVLRATFPDRPLFHLERISLEPMAGTTPGQNGQQSISQSTQRAQS
ncbi:MAG TPA: metallophosphoesterase [Gemmataceae bacterium]|jgi:Icc-related predicted phosphoesterase|nr:metallophosphoesterase [Gemmataceae bacterium]